jgi:hypothetical protein
MQINGGNWRLMERTEGERGKWRGTEGKGDQRRETEEKKGNGRKWSGMERNGILLKIIED